MTGFDHEDCPHCDEPQPSQQMDAHVAASHADLPPCTARIETEHHETYTCAFRAGHAKGQYGKWHASTREAAPGRYVWNDSADGATPHRDPGPRVVGLDEFKAMGVVSHTVVATGGQPPTHPDGGTPWCCAGRSGYVFECPLCPQYGTGLLDPCLGHGASDENQACLEAAELHARRAHPDFEYATTTGPRKQWDDVDRPPAGEDCDPDYTWERNVDAGRPGQGWERFDYTEESYWRRRKGTDAGPTAVSGGGSIFLDPRHVIPVPPSPDISIVGADGTPLVTIHPTGELEYGPNYTPDEAARAFWDALRRLAPARCPACGHIGLETT